MFSGFFRITFTGAVGSGFGVLVFHDGTIAGADVAGATFDGSYNESAEIDRVNFQVKMSLPAGVAPVQTGIPLPAPIADTISGYFLISNIGSQNPTLLETGLGPVNLLIQKIRNM
jgi:hypothetical protein